MNKNTLWVFGCSISNNRQPEERKDYVKWKGYLIKTWSEMLSTKLNYELKNHAVSGGSNFTILENFCKVVDDFKSNDIVIINWTQIERFRVAFNDWQNILPFHLNHSDLEDERKFLNKNNISISTIGEILVNRTNSLYWEEINNWNKLIENYCRLKNVKTFYWGLHFDNQSTIKYEKQNLFNYFIEKYGTIQTETNGEIIDGHFSEETHKQFANFLYKKINE